MTNSSERPSELLSVYKIEGLSGDPELERLARFAADLCDCPIALISLVDETRQRFVAKVGIDATETPRSMSFCAHAMLGDDIMEVPDATADERLCENPLVTGAPHIRFYAGAPLVSRDKAPLGTVCVISPLAREGLSEFQKSGLTVLADAVMSRLEARRVLLAKQAWEEASEADPAASEKRFRVLADAMPQMVWSTRPDGYHDYYNARWYEFTGARPGDTDGTGWNGQFHPDDQARAWNLWQRSLQSGEPYEVEYRLRRFDGQYRWTLGRALPIRDEHGRITRWFGTCTEIHEQRMLSEDKDLVSRELSHRIKNIFQVIGSMIRLSSRGEPALRAFGLKLSEQVTALGRAYDYVRVQEGTSAFTLQGMLREIFGAYNMNGAERVRIYGEEVFLSEHIMTPLALTFHELATNAAKYGALSSSSGSIDLTITRLDDLLQFEWEESGSTVQHPMERKGFGSELITASIERQLGGRFTREWLPTGLKAMATIPFMEEGGA